MFEEPVRVKKAQVAAKMKAAFEEALDSWTKSKTDFALRHLVRISQVAIEFYEEALAMELLSLEVLKMAAEKSIEDVSYLKSQILIDRANILSLSVKMKNVLDNTTLM